jgi:cysteine desulfurase
MGIFEGRPERRYFDHAASSPMGDACRAALAACDEAPWAGANPNALHGSGRAAFAALEQARRSLAHSLGASRPAEVVFTSGGTESNNLALHGAASAVLRGSHGVRRRILVSAFEHDSVLDAARAAAAALGMVCQTVPVTPAGTVDLDALAGLLGPDAALVSVMAVNNEVGTVQPVSQVARLAHDAGALVHTDAVKALGHAALDVSALGVDLASVAAHKVAGPVGVGALYVRSHVQIDPQSTGGGQEAGLRPGTQDVRGAVAFAAAAADAVAHEAERSRAVADLAARIVEGLCTGEGACARRTVDPAAGTPAIPHILHLTVPGHQSEGLLLGLDERGVEASSGSACSSGSLEPSHVLTAMGVPRDDAFCALRLSFDHRTAPADCDALGRAVREVCADVRTGRSRRRG